MGVTRAQFEEAIVPGLYGAYADEYEELPARYPSTFKVTTTKRAFEEALVTSGLGTTPVKPEAVEVAMDRPLRVGTVRMTVVSYGLGYELSQEIMDDDLYNVVGRPSSQYLAVSGRDTEERQAWALLNGAFTTTTSYDGEPIIDTAHPLAGGGTYGNRASGAQALGFTSLQAGIERFQLMVNERGLKVRTMPTKLVVPVQLQWLANEILGAEMKPHTSDNTPNVLASSRIGITVETSEYLTSATAWFLLGDKHKLMFFWRQRPILDGEYHKKSRVGSFFSWFRFGTAAFDWRYTDGNPGV